MKKQLFNPYLPTYEYVPDGEPHVFGDRLYIFGSHDKFGGYAYCENDYVCWSAPVDDLSDWRYEGVIYKREQDPTPIGELKHHMWAPDVMKGSDGRYYLYYGLEWYNRIGVAVCDTPAGKYEFYGEVKYKDGVRFGGRENEIIRFDPAVYNDNNRFYLYTGFSFNEFGWIEEKMGCKITDEGNVVVELEEDMITIKDGPKSLIPGKSNSAGTGFEGHEFYEASSIRKFGEKYYFIYSTVLSHELAYAVSDYPDREFKYCGPLHSNGNILRDDDRALYYWGNNHGSIEKVNGKYYIFGHRQTNRNEQSRQGIAEIINFENDKFLPAEMTSQGINGKPLKCEGEYQAGIACVLFAKEGACKITEANFEKHPYITQDGVDREDNPAQYVANIQDGTVVGYKYFYGSNETFKLTINVRAHNGKFVKGKVQLSTDLEFDEVVEFLIDTENETSIKNCITLKDENVALYFKYIGEGAIDLLTLTFDK